LGVIKLPTISQNSTPRRNWRKAIRRSAAYDQYFRKYSKHYFGAGFDWRWFKAQAIAESGLDEKAVSRVSAKGLMQIMPATFADMQKRNPDFSDILDRRWNIAAGISYDRSYGENAWLGGKSGTVRGRFSRVTSLQSPAPPPPGARENSSVILPPGH
jgi:soluble lytic murein transglycosylase-like protein